MFQFEFEPDLSLLVATWTGLPSIDEVASYDAAFRLERAERGHVGRPTSYIIDIRRGEPEVKKVADAVEFIIGRLGPFPARRAAVVAASASVTLTANLLADMNARVFTSMPVARDWVLLEDPPLRVARMVLNEPSVAEAIGSAVHVHGPLGVDITLTPTAALETAKRIGDAAIEALLSVTMTGPKAGRALAGLGLQQGPSPSIGNGCLGADEIAWKLGS